MATRNPAKVPMEEEESDWEYEYHDEETEDFYITLDLSSHSRQFGQGIKQSQDVDASRNLATPAPTSPGRNPPQGDEDVEADGASLNEPPEPLIVASDPTSATKQQHQKRIQIADLHTRNPLISYNSQIYSCDWTSTLGTDMLFAAVQPESSSQPPSSISQAEASPQPAPQAQPSASLIAATRIKLSARPVQVLPRAEHVSPVTSEIGMDDAAAATTMTAPTNTEPLIPLPPTAKPDRQNQAAFLTRLINIKRAKGETDEVNVHTGTRGPRRRTTSGLDGSREEGGEEDVVDTLWTPTTGPARAGRGTSRGRSRGRGRGRAGRPRKVSSGMGLFRDYRPGGLEGEVTKAQKTPKRWEDLGGPSEDAERNTTRDDVRDNGDDAGEEVVDWRQRLSEHLHGSAPVVVFPDGDGHRPREREGAGDGEEEEAEDVEMEDA